MTKTKIAVCIPMTSKKQNWMKLGDCFFITIFLPSFLRTYERHLYDYTFYVGVAKEDDFSNHYMEVFKRVCGGCDINFWVERLMLGKIGILENIFFHRSHFDYYDLVFHKKLKTWWSDDYISSLYHNYTFCCPNIRYSNRNRVSTNNTKSRYIVDNNDSKLWEGYVKESQKGVRNKKKLPETNKNFINNLN